MKFHPQHITCDVGGYSSDIITEDIPTNNLTLIHPSDSEPLRVRARIKCPACSVATCPHPGHFDIEFEQVCTQGPEVLFQAISSNTELQMWRLVVNDQAKIPSYHPGGRTGLEGDLDTQSKSIADAMFNWKGPGVAINDLIRVLSQVEDYTKSKSWDAFTKHHFIVATSAIDKPGIHSSILSGFNGIYANVPFKNTKLQGTFVSRLGDKEGMQSNVFCNNHIGQCAEVHSANRSLNADARANLSDLKFSIAYHCRTNRPRSYCLNCITLFDLNNA